MMITFNQPCVINDVTVVFPARVVGQLMPDMKDIPDAFKTDYGPGKKWVKFQMDWFYGGITATGLVAREGIDKKLALRHLGAIQGSFEPKHEHKMAAVAYLASLWFTDDSTWERVKP
jgi:hypothetical protein